MPSRILDDPWEHTIMTIGKLKYIVANIRMNLKSSKQILLFLGDLTCLMCASAGLAGSSFRTAVFCATMILLEVIQGTTPYTQNAHSHLRESKPWEPRPHRSRAESGNVPEQIHLALADPRPRDFYAMSVSWLTWRETKSQVFGSLEAEVLGNVVTRNDTSEFCRQWLVPHTRLIFGFFPSCGRLLSIKRVG